MNYARQLPFERYTPPDENVGAKSGRARSLTGARDDSVNGEM